MTENREVPAVKAPEMSSFKRISPGDRIGDLTVLCDTGKRKYRCVVWRCRCELCGNEADFISRDFFQRGVRDCGCRTNIRRFQEKIKPGDQFGKLTVISDSGERKSGEIIWNCRCVCGNVIAVGADALQFGRATDCGCVSPQGNNLLGKRFGNLTVIGDEGTRTGEHIWRCRCVCGNECLATSSHLKRGKVKSCGCLRDSVWEESLKLVDGTSVTKLEACRSNRDKLSAANTSGYNGVYPQNSHGKRTGRWVAQIGFKGKRYYLGVFDRLEDAAKARKCAEERLYDGFLEWYYHEYIPDKQKTEAERFRKTREAENSAADAINKKGIRSGQRTVEAAVLR